MAKVRETMKVTASKEAVKAPTAKDAKLLTKAGFVHIGSGKSGMEFANEENGFRIYYNDARYMVVKNGRNVDCETVREAIGEVEEQIDAEQKAKFVFLEIGDYEIETEIATCGNRKLDIANGLSWLVKQDEMIEGDTEFAEEITKWTDGISRDLIKMQPEQKADWKAWAVATSATLNETLERTKVTHGGVSKIPNLIIHFEECEVETPIQMTENFKLDLANAYLWIAGESEIVENDQEFMVEFSGKITSFVKELSRSNLKDYKWDDRFPSWEDWGKFVIATMEATNKTWLAAQKKSKSKKQDAKVG